MKFTMERNALLEALALAGRVAARRNTIPILSHALVETGRGAVRVTVTDMDRLLTAEAEAVSIDGKGATTVSAHHLAAFVKATPDGCQVEAELKGGRLVLRAGRAKASLPTLDPKDFPVRTDEAFDVSLKVKASALALALKRVVHAQSNEETRYYLNGVFLHRQDAGLRLVATDGHRLAWAALPIDEAVPAELPGVIIPRAAVADLQAFAAGGDQVLEIHVSASRVRVTFGAVDYGTKLVDGTFPDYHRVIPTEFESGFEAGRAEFQSALARCATLADVEGKGRAIKLTCEQGVVRLEGKASDDGDVEDELDARLHGKPAVTGFNSTYMAEALAALAGPSLELEISTGGPMALRDPADRDAHLQIVMAMRV
ncbi:MAG: DNA polymerase III subunit beta [Reyranellaceae bacterium]